MIDREHVLELCAPYALGALDRDEALAVESHCASCATCAAELAEMKGIASTLPLACEGTAPSPALKRRILASARGEAVVGRMLRRDPWMRGPSWAMAAGIAAAAAVIVAAFGMMDHEKMRIEVASMARQSAVDHVRMTALEKKANASETMV